MHCRLIRKMEILDKNCKKDAENIWNYLKLDQSLTIMLCFLVFGSHDLQVAEYAADLFWKYGGEVMVITGGRGRITEKIWDVPEAERFAEAAVRRGVPENRILIEPHASNTGENISFSRALMEKSGLGHVKQMTAVCQPFRERRVCYSLKKQWPEMEFSVISPQDTFEDYLRLYEESGILSAEDFVSMLTGELQRVAAYGRKGFMISQQIPEDVMQSCSRLVERGFKGD